MYPGIEYYDLLGSVRYSRFDVEFNFPISL